MKNLTIRKILAADAVFITIILIFIGLFTNWYVRSTFSEYEAINKLKNIRELELKIRKSEKEFLAYEIINPIFFRSGVSVYLEEIENDLNLINSYILDLDKQKTTHELRLADKLNHTSELFSKYKVMMKKMSKTLITKGFKDFGLVGNMRDKIHAVEQEVIRQNNEAFTIYMLTLRRHEKDYLLRKDLKYRKKFADVCKKFEEEIINSNNPAYLKLIPLLNEYEGIFNKIIDIDIAIGLDPEKGLHHSILQTVSVIESNLQELSKTLEHAAKKKINKATQYIFVLIAFLSIIIITTILGVSKHIVKSIANLKHYIGRLGNGELPDEIKIVNNDEIGQMKQSINVLTANLKNTKEFAIAVGNGNFQKEVEVFNNQGDLGNALLEMRKKLLQVSEERKTQILESNVRLWTNEGFAKIHELFSNSKLDTKSLYFNIISNLTNYVNANQGSIFFAEKEFNEIILQQKATYAFDRQKISKKKMKLGEGIIGAVAFEKRTVFMTNLPDDYIKITSGLGDATPKSLLVVPCLSENELIGVIELASFNVFEKYEIQFVEKIASDIASNIKKLNVEETTKQLLETTQKQTVELKEKEEEMRQNLEELKTMQELMVSKEEKMLEKIKDLESKNKLLENQNKELKESYSYYTDEFANAFE